MLSDSDFLHELVDRIKTSPPPLTISETIEGVRILPKDSPFPGPWSNARTPYIVEPMEWASPYSGVNVAAHMWSAQVGKTAGLLENPLQYYIGSQPTKVMFVTASGDLARKWSADRFDPIIDSCGLRGLIEERSQEMAGRKVADQILTKYFPGGAVFITSAGSGANLRSTSVQVVLIDEIDGAKAELNTGEGYFLDVVRARTQAFRGQGLYKIIMVSTPGLLEKSEIYRVFLEGDQCRYHVPCPFCGALQPFEWNWDGEDGSRAWGLDGVYTAGELSDVVYKCRHCGEGIHEHKKPWMLSAGMWVPEAKPISANYRSTHLNTLYSPVGMCPWSEVWVEYERAQNGDEDSMRAFMNLILGLPYQRRGNKPRVEEAIELVRGYDEWTVPDGVAFLTCAVDVQKGSTGKRKASNPMRLEVEVKGHGLQYRTWSIGYLRFEGDVTSAHSGAWADFFTWVQNFSAKGAGRDFQLSMGGVDSGAFTDVVYDFVSSGLVRGFYATKGTKELKEARGQSLDPLDKGRLHFKVTTGAGATPLILISTTYYKRHLYRNLQHSTGDPLPPGGCAFPRTYKKDYFDMLTAEEETSEGFVNKKGRRNEALDLHVMNSALADAVIHSLLTKERERLRAMGYGEADIKSLGRDHIVNALLNGGS